MERGGKFGSCLIGYNGLKSADWDGKGRHKVTQICRDVLQIGDYAICTEGHKDHMSQRKTPNAKRKIHCALHPPPSPPPFNFNIFLKYFKYLYFNFYLNLS